MPHPGKPRPKGRGIPATVCIYPLVNVSQVEPDQKASFYRAVRAAQIKRVQSDSTGYFEVSLDTGSYSLFLLIGGLYYARQTDQYNHLNPVHVAASRQTNVDITYANRVTY